MPKLGHEPKTGYDVLLVKDNDWIQAGRRSDGNDWPPGTVITVKLGELAAWPATIAGPNVSWHVDKTVVNTVRALIDAQSDTVRALITYVDGTGLDLWLTTGKAQTRA